MRGVPTETLQNIEWAVDSTKSSNKIELVSTTTFNSQQISKLDLMLSKINGYAMTARYETVYTATYSMSMTQRSTADSFRNVAMVQWAPNQKISTELDISIAYVESIYFSQHNYLSLFGFEIITVVGKSCDSFYALLMR